MSFNLFKTVILDLFNFFALDVARWKIAIISALNFLDSEGALWKTGIDNMFVVIASMGDCTPSILFLIILLTTAHFYMIMTRKKARRINPSSKLDDDSEESTKFYQDSEESVEFYEDSTESAEFEKSVPKSAERLLREILEEYTEILDDEPFEGKMPGKLMGGFREYFYKNMSNPEKEKKVIEAIQKRGLCRLDSFTVYCNKTPTEDECFIDYKRHILASFIQYIYDYGPKVLSLEEFYYIFRDKQCDRKSFGYALWCSLHDFDWKHLDPYYDEHQKNTTALYFAKKRVEESIHRIKYSDEISSNWSDPLIINLELSKYFDFDSIY